MDESTRSAGAWVGARNRMIRSWLVPASAAVILIMTAFGATALAANEASVLPPNWHIHDGQTALGSQHKGIGFFPTILGISAAQYLQDPARCPNATDKAFLPSFGQSEGASLRAGECQTSTAPEAVADRECDHPEVAADPRQRAIENIRAKVRLRQSEI